MASQKLAIEGGSKAVSSLSKLPSKLGKEELFSLIDLWVLPEKTKGRIKKILDKEKNIEGPHLFRYYNPRPSRVKAAEELFAKFIGTKYCLAVNSCTSALVASYRALGIGMGDEVIVPAYTFFATAATVAACNAIPVIVDVDDSLTMDPEDVKKKITPRTKAIVPVHMRGVPAQMDAIMDIAQAKGIPVVEDVAQSAGGSFKGKKLGSIGTMGCFSFDYYKILNCGEGGFITTDDQWLYTRAQSWHDTAACWRPDRFASERKEGELFCGENYRMSELQGAVAVAQIKKGNRLIAGYRKAKKRILSNIELPKSVLLQRQSDPEGEAAICIIMFLPNIEATKWALKAMQAEGVPAGGIYDSKIKDWHIYTYWEHIINRKSVSKDGLPWSGAPEAELCKYTRESCPRTLDYLSRAIMVDVNAFYTADDCKQIAAGINKVLFEMEGRNIQ